MKRLRKRKLLLIPAFLLLPFFLFYGGIFGGWALSAVHNEITLHNFARPFLEYPLPPRSVEVERLMNWGTLMGNGNHCDFEVSRILRTELSETEIEAHYENVEFPSIVPVRSSFAAITGRDGMLVVHVEFDDEHPGFARVSLTDGIYSGTFWDFACN